MVNALRLAGWDASRQPLYGANDMGDVLSGRLVIEVKAGQQAHEPGSALLASWQEEASVEAARHGPGMVAVLVAKRKGYSHTRALRWWAWVREPVSGIWVRAEFGEVLQMVDAWSDAGVTAR